MNMLPACLFLLPVGQAGCKLRYATCDSCTLNDGLTELTTTTMTKLRTCYAISVYVANVRGHVPASTGTIAL